MMSFNILDLTAQIAKRYQTLLIHLGEDELLLRYLIFVTDVNNGNVRMAYEQRPKWIKIDNLIGFLTCKVFLNTYIKDWKMEKGNSKTSIKSGDISLTIPRELYEKKLSAMVKYGQCLHYALQPVTFSFSNLKFSQCYFKNSLFARNAVLV